MLRRPLLRVSWIALLAAIVTSAAMGCRRTSPEPATATPPQTVRATEPTPPNREAVSNTRHDLSEDERQGGHTLARHVGRTDAELAERLRREPEISSASTYTDRATAEAVVGAALMTTTRAFTTWQRRTGRRPNFALHYDAHRVIGRSLSRGRQMTVPCERAVVVFRWNDVRHRFYVLTSYPEERR
jgi:hypothetical protein